MKHTYKDILQICPVPPNVYIEYQDKENPAVHGFQQAICLALVEEGRLENGQKKDPYRSVEVMAVQGRNWVDLEHSRIMRGLVVTDTPPTPIWTHSDDWKEKI